MAHENSPSAVMYAELKTLGISNRDAAATLLQTDKTFGDTTLMDRINVRSVLSRNYVRVAPGEVPASLFKDFAVSSQTLMGRIIAKSKKDRKGAAASIGQVFSGSAAAAMRDALREYGIDDSVYRNALAYIDNLDIANGVDKDLLYFMLFVVTGCTGDPREGARLVEQFSSDNVGAFFRTVEAQVGIAPEQEEDEGFALGLMRIVGGKLKGQNAFYRLDPGPRGTEIGALSTEPGAITDVDADVSRRHARIYKQGAHWYIEGLKSTNGTTVISGEDKMEHVVEPPRKDRERDYAPAPYEIFPTDTICLGSSTRFMVMPMLDD